MRLPWGYPARFPVPRFVIVGVSCVPNYETEAFSSSPVFAGGLDSLLQTPDHPTVGAK